jgi:hypothetical protein
MPQKFSETFAALPSGKKRPNPSLFFMIARVFKKASLRLWETVTSSRFDSRIQKSSGRNGCGWQHAVAGSQPDSRSGINPGST